MNIYETLKTKYVFHINVYQLYFHVKEQISSSNQKIIRKTDGNNWQKSHMGRNWKILIQIRNSVTPIIQRSVIKVSNLHGSLANISRHWY